MSREIPIYPQDIEKFLTPEERCDFLKTKVALDEYQTKQLEYYRERRETLLKAAENIRNGNLAGALIGTKALPSKPIAEEGKYDLCINIVRKRKLAYLQREERLVAEQQESFLRRQEEEKRKLQVRQQREIFITGLRRATSEFRKALATKKKPQFVYPPLIGEYAPHKWCELDLPTTGEMERWATPIIGKKIPDSIRGLVSWDIKGELLALPYAHYEFAGLPCLEWCFKIQALAIARLSLMETQVVKEFSGVRCRIPVAQEELGQVYAGPVEWDDQEGFTTPIALLRLLTGVEMETPGMTIISHDSVTTVYTVEGYDEYFVELYTGFIDFIRTISKDHPFFQALSSLGIVDSGTARLLQEKWALPLPCDGKSIVGGSPSLDAAIAKLTELGWTEADAKEALASSTFPGSASTEEIIKIILGKC